MRVIEKIAYAFSHAVIFAAPNLLCLAVFDKFDSLNLDRVDIRRAEKPGNRYRSRADAVYECRRKQNNILEAIEEGGSARLAARLRALEEQEAQLTFALGEINNAPAPPA